LIRSKRGLITSGIVIFVLGFVVLFPARVAINWIAPPGVVVSNAFGTAWDGGAEEASIEGMYLRDVSWSLNALQLFTGKLAYQVSASPASGFLDSELKVNLGGRIFLSDMTAALPLEYFSAALGEGDLQGNASLNFERIEIVDGLAVVADGVMQVANVVVPVIGRDSLGSFKLEFRSQNNGIVASVENTDDVIKLAGSLQIKTDRSFEFLGQVIVTPNTPQNIRRQLKFLPPPDERGQQELRLEGVL
jgi:hypothetical protein